MGSLSLIPLNRLSFNAKIVSFSSVREPLGEMNDCFDAY